MKSGALLFFSGLALGVGGMLVIKPSAQDTGQNEAPGEDSRNDPADPHLRQAIWEARASRRYHGHHANRGDARSNLEQMLVSLSKINDESQLDLMRLIRQAATLTRLNESEAIDLLYYLSEPEAEAHAGEWGEFNEAASAIIFSRLCELNGPEAMRLATDERFADNLEEEAVAMGMNSWVAADPEGARKWFEGAMADADAMIAAGDDTRERSATMKVIEMDELRESYFNGMAKIDPQGLEETISHYESEDIRNAMRNDLMTSLVAQENQPEGLLELLEKNRDLPEVRLSAVEKLSKLDPIQAAGWVEAQPPGKGRDNEINAVAAQLMDRDVDAGINWYMSQEILDFEREKDRMSRITYKLAQNDASKASRWVEQQPDDATRDHAEIAMAWTRANQQDWSRSMLWLAGVEDRTSRENTLNQLLSRGWDLSEGGLKPEVLSAAESAGFGEAARAYRPK